MLFTRIKPCHRCLFNFDLLSLARALARSSTMHHCAYGYHRTTWPLSKFISSRVFGPLNCWFNISFPSVHGGTIISRRERASPTYGIFRRERSERNGTLESKLPKPLDSTLTYRHAVDIFSQPRGTLLSTACRKFRANRSISQPNRELPLNKMRKQTANW